MLTVKLILERLDREGRLLEKREQRSRSFVRNFIGLLYCAHAQIQTGAPYGMTDIDGNPQDIDSRAVYGTSYAERGTKGTLMVGAPPGHSQLIVPIGERSAAYYYRGLIGELVGIQVGTGVAAVTPTDIALATRIAHGRAAGELEYGGCELVGIAFADPNGEFTIRRYFTNASGGSITVNEVGIHSVGTWYTISGSTQAVWAFLIARDLTGGVAVADTEILRATYVPQITV